MRNLIKSFAKDESGATAIEYGLIAALLSVAIIAAISSVRDELTTTYEGIARNWQLTTTLAAAAHNLLPLRLGGLIRLTDPRTKGPRQSRGLVQIQSRR